MTARTAWLGLATMGVLQYMGPRPLFVRTAWADGPAEVCEVATQEAGGGDKSELVLVVEADAAMGGGCEGAGFSPLMAGGCE